MTLLILAFLALLALPLLWVAFMLACALIGVCIEYWPLIAVVLILIWIL